MFVPSINNNKLEGEIMTKNIGLRIYSTFCTDSAISISASLPVFEPIPNT